MLMLGMATTDTDTVATDGGATTGLTATTVTTERGPPMLSLQLSQLLLLTQTPTLMRRTDTTDTMERGLLRLSQSLLLPLIPMLMLMPGTAPTDTGVTGAKPNNREVDSSSDCDFPSTLASIS